MYRRRFRRSRSHLGAWVMALAASVALAETPDESCAPGGQPGNLELGAESGPDATGAADGSHDPQLWVVVRTGIRQGFAFRLIETVLLEGRWIKADVGYFDSGSAGEYRRMWVGGGGAVVALPALRLELKGALSWGEGSATAGERYLESNAYLVARPDARWRVEVSYTESYPLNDEAVRAHTLDRARLEYELGSYRVGGGYAGYRAGPKTWEHRPFVSVSRPVRGLGEVEVWLQRVESAEGSRARLQLRLSRRLGP